MVEKKLFGYPFMLSIWVKWKEYESENNRG